MKRNELNSEKNEVLYQVLILFIIPITLVYSGLIPEEWRIIFLSLFCLFIIAIIKHEKWSNAQIGLRKDNIRKSLLPYSVITLAGVICLYYFSNYFGLVKIVAWWENNHLIYFFIPISFFQEFAYRSFLVPMLHHAFKKRVSVILVNATLFSFLHVIYPLPHIMLPVAFVAGIIFALLYEVYPNLFLISVMHAVLNFTAVYLGFFSVN